MGAILKGLTWSLIITIILGIIVTLILQFTSLSENYLTNLSTFIFFVSMLLGSTLAARSAGNKGLWHGLSVSIIYLALTLIIGFIWIPDFFSVYLILKRLAFTFASGVLGGIIGVGLAK